MPKSDKVEPQDNIKHSTNQKLSSKEYLTPEETEKLLEIMTKAGNALDVDEPLLVMPTRSRK